MFDHSRTVEIQGVVKKFQYTSPHSWLMVVVKNADGDEVTWNVEFGAPSVLAHLGVFVATLPVGEKVKVIMYPMRDGTLAGEFKSVEDLATGKIYGGEGKAADASGDPASK